MSQFSTIFISLTSENTSKQAIKNHQDKKNVFLPMAGRLKHHSSLNEYLSCVKSTVTDILVNRFSLYKLQTKPYFQGRLSFVSFFLEFWSLRVARVFFHSLR